MDQIKETLNSFCAFLSKHLHQYWFSIAALFSISVFVTFSNITILTGILKILSMKVTTDLLHLLIVILNFVNLNLRFVHVGNISV